MSFLDEIEERVVAAYRSKGLKARPYGFTADGQQACCAIGAVLQGEHDLEGMNLNSVAMVVGVDSNELVSFTLGFDRALDSSQPPTEDELADGLFRVGFTVGERVIREGLCVDGFPRRMR